MVLILVKGIIFLKFKFIMSCYGQYAHYHDADKASDKYAANKAANHFNQSFQIIILARRLPRIETFPFSRR